MLHPTQYAIILMICWVIIYEVREKAFSVPQTQEDWFINGSG